MRNQPECQHYSACKITLNAESKKIFNMHNDSKCKITPECRMTQITKWLGRKLIQNENDSEGKIIQNTKWLWMQNFSGCKMTTNAKCLSMEIQSECKMNPNSKWLRMQKDLIKMHGPYATLLLLFLGTLLFLKVGSQRKNKLFLEI